MIFCITPAPPTGWTTCAYFRRSEPDTGRLASRCVISLDLSGAHTAADLRGDRAGQRRPRCAHIKGNRCRGCRPAAMPVSEHWRGMVTDSAIIDVCGGC
jgi:hypothetical protein